MQRESYLEMRQIEDWDWWFVGRRAVLKRILDVYSPGDANRTILEIGCGTGGNLSLLSKYGRLSAMELNEEAREMANRRSICRVESGFLPDGIPFTELFDLICMFDVLEHIEKDRASLEAVRQKLRPNGRLILTVPAYPFLWSTHDLVLDHKRRYLKKGLFTLMKDAGLSPLYSTHFNTFLFPPIAMALLFTNLFHKDGSQMKLHPLNRLFLRIFSSERFFLPGRVFPFGVSILVVAEPSPQSDGRITR